MKGLHLIIGLIAWLASWCNGMSVMENVISKLKQLHREEGSTLINVFIARSYLLWYKNNAIPVSRVKGRLRYTMQSAILNR